MTPAAERKSIGLDVAWQQEPAAEQQAAALSGELAKLASSELAKLAADPVAFVEALPAVKRGASRRALNLDVPGELGDWYVKWCRQQDVSQRDVLRALFLALRADVESR